MRKWLIAVVGVVAVAAGATAWWVRSNAREPIAEREGKPMDAKVVKTEAQWREQLTADEFRVTRQHGTERAFTGRYWDSKEDGVYTCVCCGQKLFDSKTKYESGTGWPSYWSPVDDNAVSLKTDRSWFMTRVEVVCSRCDAHLGHVFDDGPEPTGQRYCMNGTAMKFQPREEK